MRRLKNNFKRIFSVAFQISVKEPKLVRAIFIRRPVKYSPAIIDVSSRFFFKLFKMIETVLENSSLQYKNLFTTHFYINWV